MRLPDSTYVAAGAILLFWLIRAAFSDGVPLFWTNRRLRAMWDNDTMNTPMHLPCNIPSPDGVLFCRLECGHSGWHSHHGPVSWHSGQWAEDDSHSRFGNIPW
jgi:hypothetical protein